MAIIKHIIAGIIIIILTFIFAKGSTYSFIGWLFLLLLAYKGIRSIGTKK